MIETKDPAIKLFGQKILCPGEDEALIITSHENVSHAAMDVEDETDRFFSESENEEEEEEEEEKEKKKDSEADKDDEKKKEADPPPNAAETKNNNNSPATLHEGIQNPKTRSIDEETSKSENEQSDTTANNNTQEKALKKPDKLLPCPRCNSADTKFCYYNNYNINQPRYFCKACQRYWTAGGTMRNVPVGAGRRKNKNNSSSHYRHITISEALDAARIISPNGTHHLQNLKNNGRVLSFGLDHPHIYDSMSNDLSPAGKNGLSDARNNGDHCSSASSITASKPMDESVKRISQDSLPQQNNGFLPHVPCMTSVPWPYPWSSGAIPSPQTLCPPGFPMSFYPAPFWNVPWFPAHTSTTTPTSSPKSPTLGKHSRDDDTNNNDEIAKQDHLRKEESPKQRNGGVLVPKTLRIDDPNEAAKSSIWETLGIKNEGVSRGGMIKAFQSKKDGKNHVKTSPMLMANPAALARSLNFHENS